MRAFQIALSWPTRGKWSLRKLIRRNRQRGQKTVAVTTGAVGSEAVILGLNRGDVAAIASMADDVREAILYAHDNWSPNPSER